MVINSRAQATSTLFTLRRMKTAKCWQITSKPPVKKDGAVNPRADKNWRFVPIKGNDKLDVRFETSPSEQTAQFIKENAQYPMKQVGTDEVGFAVYQI